MFLFPLGGHVHYLEQSTIWLVLGFGKLSSTLTGIFSINSSCVLMVYLLILPLHNYIQTLVVLSAVCWRSEYATIHVLKCFLRTAACFGMV